jgi:hypothetical protein
MSPGSLANAQARLHRVGLLAMLGPELAGIGSCMTPFADILDSAKTRFDLTDPEDRESLLRLTNRLLERGDRAGEDLAEAAHAADAPLELRLAEKLVDSRRWLETCTRPLRVAVVFAMWGEHHRLLPRSADNPHGEDSLRVKLSQLDWATAGTPVDDSRKAGAVILGCMHALADGADAVVYTDADNSVHLGQLADVPADRLGDPALMPPVEIRDWIRSHRPGG